MSLKKHSPAITQRFLQICDEVVQSGVVRNKTAFAISVGEYQQNLKSMEAGTRTPTLEQITEACVKYGYSANWVILNTGEKKIRPAENLTIERRVSDLESQMVTIKRMLKKK